jgi:hypothetical protein
MEYATEKERLDRMALGHTSGGSDLRRPDGGLSFLVLGHYSLDGTKHNELRFVVSERPKQLPLYE